jgi:hypothetical protein
MGVADDGDDGVHVAIAPNRRQGSRWTSAPVSPAVRLTRATKCVTLRAADIACRYNGCMPVELLPVRRLPEAPRALRGRPPVLIGLYIRLSTRRLLTQLVA